MFPHIQIFLRQTGRSKTRLVLNLILLCAATAFFVLSMNLYCNSMENLQTVENSYATIATVEFYGYVNEAGELVSPGDESCVGRHWLSVEDYDLSPLLALDSVKGIDHRTRVGAYIPGHIPIYDETDRLPLFYAGGYVLIFKTQNVIKFTVDLEDPLVIPLPENEWKNVEFPIRVLETSNSLLEYPDTFTLHVGRSERFHTERMQAEIRRLNRSDVTDSITLYPGVEYVLITSGGAVWKKDPETGVYTWYSDWGPYSQPMEWYDGIGLSLNGFSSFYDENLFHYTKRGFRPMVSDSLTRAGPFALHRYEDVKDDSEWAEYTQAAEYTANSFAVTLTDDIARIPAWYAGAMYLNEGRMITEEEYASGAKVCMVSAQMATYQGWQVGDKLEMHLYAYNGFYDETSIIKSNYNLPQNYLLSPTYTKSCDGFFEEDTYEIVGIFGQKEFDGYGDSAPEVYYNPWNAIYVPANAAPNAPTGPIQPSLLTVYLKNGSIGSFKQAVEEMGLTDSRAGEYAIRFHYFDQGYSKIKPGLDEMHHNALLLLSLSVVLLMATLILLAFLFSQHYKHSVGILRMLGGSKKQAFAAVMICAAVVVLASGVLGSVIGGVLTQSVSIGSMDAATASAKVALSTGANWAVTALSGAGCAAVFLVLIAGFTNSYMNEEPRALLPQNKT